MKKRRIQVKQHPRRLKTGGRTIVRKHQRMLNKPQTTLSDFIPQNKRKSLPEPKKKKKEKKGVNDHLPKRFRYIQFRTLPTSLKKDLLKRRLKVMHSDFYRDYHKKHNSLKEVDDEIREIRGYLMTFEKDEVFRRSADLIPAKPNKELLSKAINQNYESYPPYYALTEAIMDGC